jgi:uncharacterized protein YraI
METQYGFTRYSSTEFEAWVKSISVSRVVNKIQQHHTWSPNYSHFSGSNHFELQKNMKNHHVSNNGWADIGQHFSIFPDGSIVTGRPLNVPPACIYGNNAGSICIENVGDFDTGKDQMTDAQRQAIVRSTAALALRFNLRPVTTNNIVYHHWFDLNTGERTNESGVTKTCPGTAFFGGNTVSACVAGFLPLVQARLDGSAPAIAAAIPDFGVVVASALTIRSGPGTTFPAAQGQGALTSGSIVRIFRETDGWLKITNSSEHWIYANWVRSVTRRIVNTDDTKGRSGPGTDSPILTAYSRGDVLFVHETEGSWSKVAIGNLWVHSSLLD